MSFIFIARILLIVLNILKTSEVHHEVNYQDVAEVEARGNRPPLEETVARGHAREQRHKKQGSVAGVVGHATSLPDFLVADLSLVGNLSGCR